MRAIAAVVVIALGVVGCSPTKTALLSQCKVDAYRTFPNGPDVERRVHIESCMAAKNYEWIEFISPTSTTFCGPDPMLLAYEPNCYRRVGLMKRLTDH